jgi:hypothetical protein
MLGAVSGVRMTLDLFAAGAVIALPFVVVALGRWAAQGPAGRTMLLGAWIVPVVAFLSGAAGAIHLLAIEPHLEESRLHAGAFAALAAFQLLWAVGYPARPSRWLGWSAVIVNAGAVAVWLASRTVGLPGWLDGGPVEPVGLADTVSTVLELGVVVGLLALLWRPMRVRLIEGRAITRADAALGTAMVIAAASLLTLGAIAEIASGAHGHAEGEGPPAVVAEE